jgi:indole-3-glycerol phosphate synthase/phosphoribosylanthranilate isomerase/anthranilate synthase/indole-3-glycerol phosphate synthase/phosphoribosylanthranilate isomerase
MSTILSEILDRKREVVARLRADAGTRDLQKRAVAIRANANRHVLLRVLARTPRFSVPSAQRADPTLNIIAEFKRRSPSAGTIRSDLSATDVATRYERGGACAISVLTDEHYFGGSMLDLAAIRAVTALPLLRKDFIIDEIQIYEAAAAGADAVLLIVAALDDCTLAKLRATAEDELGLDALVEVHTSEELRRAVKTGARIIGVNNRDLRTFRTSLETSERMIAEAPRDQIMISESGLQDPKSLWHLRALGFRGFLIGEPLMRASDPEKALRDLIVEAENPELAQISCSHRPVAGPAGVPTAHRAVATEDPSNRIQIKICGVTNANDARACVELGADMIGFNFYPASPRYIEPTIVRRIVDTLPAGTSGVGVFVDADPEEIRKVAQIAGIRCVQLHGHATPEMCGELAREFRVIRALSTDPRFEPEHIAAFSHCDVLIDSFHPELRGGTGQTCDWSAARAAMAYTRFLILSGGLNARNIGRAIAAVMPHAVDVCSGIESAPGVKDHRALEQFINAVRAAQLSVRVTSTHKPLDNVILSEAKDLGSIFVRDS